MEHNQHQNSELYYNYNLGVRKSIGYNDYVNYYNANASQIIERKVITILVNLIGEYTNCFINHIWNTIFNVYTRMYNWIKCYIMTSLFK